jgi:hypothetical protein
MKRCEDAWKIGFKLAHSQTPPDKNGGFYFGDCQASLAMT